MNITDNHSIANIDLDTLLTLPDFQLALEIAQAVLALYTHCQERPRLQNWYSQVSRSATSIVANIAEAYGKAKGWWLTSYLCARGEAFETAAWLLTGPEEAKTLQPKVKDLVNIMNERIKDFTPQLTQAKKYRT